MTEEDEAFNEIERQARQRKESVMAAMRGVEEDDDIQIYQRTWVDLTDEEMHECNMDGDFMVDREIAKLNVQAKLKEKNT